MELQSVLLARAFLLFPTTSLDPDGHLYFPDLVEALVKKYRFVKYPQKPEEFVAQNGITFEMGEANGTVIDKISIFPGGVALDTRKGTNVSEELLAETLQWAAEEFDLHFRPEFIRRKVYVGTLLVQSDVALIEVNPALQRIAEIVSKQVSGDTGRNLVYVPASLGIGYDKQTTTFTPSAFTVERREGVPFSDNVYFSNAPLPTQLHLQLLAEIENAVTNASR
jgi:hypothetical protein